MRRIVWILLCLLLTTLAAAAQDQLTRVEHQLDEIEEFVSAVRELNALEDTRVLFLSRDEAAAYLEARFHEDYPPELLEKLYLVYRALDLAEPGLDLGGLILEFMLSRIAGYYDAESDTMTVILPSDETPLDGLAAPQRMTYAHEFAHALQDQHYDLSALAERWSNADSLDYRLALSALVEGDATLTSSFYFDLFDWFLEQNQDQAMSELEAAARAVAEPPDNLPPIIEAEIHFAYVIGTEFAAQVSRQSDWADINRALRDKPILTAEHIFHPERFLAGEPPIVVDPPDLSAILHESWTLVYNNSVGEFYLRQHLRTQFSSDDVTGLAPGRGGSDIYLRQRLRSQFMFSQDNAARLTQGWGGDRLQIFVDATGDEMIWTWRLVWDTERDAERFTVGYRSFLDWRYGEYTDDPQCWIGETTHCVVRFSSVETRITMASDEATARALLALRS